MEKEQQYFDRLIQSRIAPIYFFDEKNPPPEKKLLTVNGTVTLVKKGHQIFGITNFHVYKHYKEKKGENANYVCQIGHKLSIKLEERMTDENAKHDLCVFYLEEHELSKMGTKGGFKHVRYDISNLLHQYQREENPETWALHFAGYPGEDKNTKQISDKEYEKNFGIFLSSAPASYCPVEEKITLKFCKARQAIEKGELRNDFEPLKESAVNFGGISGGPVFARVDPNQDDLSLLGIIYEGGDGKGFLPEVIYARPISLLQETFDKLLK